MYTALHKEESKLRYKKWLDENRKHFNEYQKEYRGKNKAVILPRIRAKQQAKLKSDPKFKLRRIVSRYIWGCLKSRNVPKNDTTLKLLGYSLEELLLRIESTFKEGMTWENHGKWHIDHIKPIAQFDLTNEAQLRLCWALDNLQALWAKDNLIKASKYGNAS